MSTSPIIPISYKNTSGEAIPAFACVQLSGDSVQNGTTGSRSVSVNKPDGTGPYAIDTGTGAGTSSDALYSQCVIPQSHTWWVKYNGSVAPATAWVTEVGPVSGQWYMDTTGTGYLYAGAFDSTNGLILVVEAGSSTSGGGGNCGCCDCSNCASPENATVLECTSCVSAPRQYTFNVGSGGVFPGIGGYQTATYDTACRWVTDTFALTTAPWVGSRYYMTGDYVTNDSGKQYICVADGVSLSTGGPTGTGSGISDGSVTWDYQASTGTNLYRWVRDNTAETLTLEFVSGQDVFNTTRRPMSYAAETPFSCDCELKFKQSDVSKVLPGVTVDCSICIKPTTTQCDCCHTFTMTGHGGTLCDGYDGTWRFVAYDPDSTFCYFPITPPRGTGGTPLSCWFMSWNRSSHLFAVWHDAISTYPNAPFPNPVYSAVVDNPCESKIVLALNAAYTTACGIAWPSTLTVYTTRCESTTTTSSTTTPSTTSTSTTTGTSTTTSTSTTTGTSTTTDTSTTTGTSTTTDTSTTTGTTTTGSTTTGCVVNGCTWTWTSGAWVNTGSTCVVPCAACLTPPPFSGNEGDTATTTCEIIL